MRKLWIAVAILAGLALVADTAARVIAQREAGKELGRQFDLAQAPDVSFSGWPFLLHLASGEFDAVRIKSARLSQGAVALTDVDLRLEDVEVDLSKLLDGDPQGFRAGSGRGSAALTGEAVSAILAEQDVRADVSIEGGVLFVTPEEIGQTFEGVVGLEGNLLTIEGGGGALDLEIELPSIAEGMTYDSVELQGDAAVLKMSFKDAVFTPD